MNLIFYTLIAAGILVFLSQSSYAMAAGSMYHHRDHITIPRLRPLQKRADVIHCAHHSVHAICGLLLIPTSLALLRSALSIPIMWILSAAWMLCAIDALVFLYHDHRYNFRRQRDEITLKWKGEKVFGAEHDNEVSLYRTLKEMTTKNLKRDFIHGFVFVILYIISL